MRCNALWAHFTGGNFYRFPKGHWRSLDNPNGKKCRSFVAVQGDCETVYQSPMHSWCDVCNATIRSTWPIQDWDIICIGASRFAPGQWETTLLCNGVSHWLGATLESALHLHRCLWEGKISLKTNQKCTKSERSRQTTPIQNTFSTYYLRSNGVKTQPEGQDAKNE